MPLKGKLKKNQEEKPQKERRQVDPKLVRIGKGALIVIVTAFLAIMILARIMPDEAALTVPENGVAQVVSPIQTAFANATEMVVSYLRKLKYRANLELEYNKLKAENDRLVPQAMLADELQIQLAMYKDMIGEMTLNEMMQPVLATVIGKDEGNYTATLIINKGSRDGIKDLMAVTVNGALVGYTIETKETTAHIKTIIDNDASVPALIQSTRDEGNIRGTLGTDGKAMCRMYHTDEYIPRPGDQVVTSGKTLPFPKGIPIGVVRESTRGMDANKQYIVVEPLADFDHLEYVIVYLYQPIPDTEIKTTSSGMQIEYIPLDTPRPMPTIQVGGSAIHSGVAASPDANASQSPDPSATPSATPSPGIIATPQAPVQPGDSIVYQDPNAAPTATPTPGPSPTPEPTQSITIDDLTLEDD